MKKQFYRVLTAGLLLAGNYSVEANADSEVSVEGIRFEDLVADDTLTLEWSWKALGTDDQGRVYVVFGGPTAEGLADCVLLSYDAVKGERRNLGHLSEPLITAGNWHEGERIEKGHTALPFVDGKILIGTQGFHDAAGGMTNPNMIAALATRGAHIVGYDVEGDELLDLSANQPGGVFYSGRGFLELAAVPGTDLLAALTVPHGDMLLFDVSKERVVAKVPGVKERFGDRPGRVLLAAPDGRVFYSSHVNSNDAEMGRMYSVDTKTGKRNPEPTMIPPGVWNGLARSKDGQSIYVCAQNGALYRLDYEKDDLVQVGDLVPESLQSAYQDEDYYYQAPQVHGIALSEDERKIVCIPFRRRVALGDLPPEGTRISGGTRVGDGVFVFDLETGITTKLADLPDALAGGYFTGNDARDSEGAVYFSRHGASGWGLVRIQTAGL